MKVLYSADMKLFQACNMEIIRLAQQMFNFVLPSELIEKRANKFLPVSCLLWLVNIVTYLIRPPGTVFPEVPYVLQQMFIFF